MLNLLPHLPLRQATSQHSHSGTNVGFRFLAKPRGVSAGRWEGQKHWKAGGPEFRRGTPVFVAGAPSSALWLPVPGTAVSAGSCVVGGIRTCGLGGGCGDILFALWSKGAPGLLPVSARLHTYLGGSLFQVVVTPPARKAHVSLWEVHCAPQLRGKFAEQEAASRGELGRVKCQGEG